MNLTTKEFLQVCYKMYKKAEYKSPYLLQKYLFCMGKYYKIYNFYNHSKLYIHNSFFLKKFTRPIFNNRIRFYKFIKPVMSSLKPHKFFLWKNNKPGISFGKRVGFSKRKKCFYIPNVSYPGDILLNKLHMAISIVFPNVTNKLFFKIITSTGELYYLPGPVQIKFFKIYHAYLKRSAHPVPLHLISRFYNYIYTYAVFSKISNVTLNFSYKFQIALSRGSYAKILYYSKKKKLVRVALPSKKEIFINYLMLAFRAYVNNDLLKFKIKINKHSYFKFNGKKSIVRGVAKNPVDHPNGGNTKSKPKYKTPWGKLTK